MLDIEKIKSYYPTSGIVSPRNLLREYLQYKILAIIYRSEFGKKLIFIGGTALRIVHNTNRFSEDLDFDNIGLSQEEFEKLSELIKIELTNDGMEVEIKVVNRNAFHCYIKFPGMLYKLNLSGYESEKILIQLDTESQKFVYAHENIFLNKFDVFEKIQVAPPDILLAQKVWAILNRKTPKGRDFYDATYLFSVCQPNYDYLQYKCGIGDFDKLKEQLLNKCDKIEFDELVKDVEPFLVDIKEITRVKYFREFIKSLK
jgi:predicted nucleotidyltransferase component of viral defense system